MGKPKILVAGAGINGLVAANYLQRAGCRVTMIERGDRVGGACVSELAEVNGVRQHYALGASVLDNVYLCGSGTYPCGSVTGTPGYMCSQQLLRRARAAS